MTVQLDAKGVIESRVRLRRHYGVLCLLSSVPAFWHSDTAVAVVVTMNFLVWLMCLIVLTAEIRGLRRDYEVMNRHRER